MDNKKEQELNNLINTLTTTGTNTETKPDNEVLASLTTESSTPQPKEEPKPVQIQESVNEVQNVEQQNTVQVQENVNGVQNVEQQNTVQVQENVNEVQNVEQQNIVQVQENVNEVQNVEQQNIINNNMVDPNQQQVQNGNQINNHFAPPPESKITNLEIDFGDSLLRAYVGKHYNRIAKRKINFAAFLFGPLYLLYRKYFLYGVLIILASICAFAILIDYQLYVAIGLFVTYLIIGIMFNTAYISKANRKIYNIKLDNPHARPEELQKMLADEGGTAFMNIFSGFLSASVLVYATSYVLTGFDISMYDNIFNNYNYEGVLFYNPGIKIEENFEIPIPQTFKKETSMGLFEYSFTKKKDKKATQCTMSLNALDKFVNAKRLISQMQKSYKDFGESTDIEEKEINGIKWYGFMITNEFGKHYNYAAKVDDHVFLYNFEIQDATSAECEMYATGILYSIKDKENSEQNEKGE